jgi:hypothetical protein
MRPAVANRIPSTHWPKHQCKVFALKESLSFVQIPQTKMKVVSFNIFVIWILFLFFVFLFWYCAVNLYQFSIISCDFSHSVYSRSFLWSLGRLQRRSRKIGRSQAHRYRPLGQREQRRWQLLVQVTL